MSTNDKLIMRTTYPLVMQWFTRLIFVAAIAAPPRAVSERRLFGAATCEKSDEFFKSVEIALSIFSVRGGILGGRKI